VWHSEDHYLDIEVRTGAGAALADVDELLDAVRVGLLTPEIAERAVRRAVDTIDGLAGNGYDLATWLAGKGIDLTWRRASTQ
jgi:predicted RNA-binding protein associated with RNAse of E/G family